MSTLMKRSLMALMCTGLTASMVIAQSGSPAVPPVPSKDSMKDQASDAAKKAMEDAKKKAEEAMKGAKDAAKDAMGGGAPSPEQQKMMDEMTKAMQPGAMHEWLKKWEGEWDMTVKFFGSPGGEAVENKMTASSSLIMDGRFLVEKVSGEIEFPGMGKAPFQGQSTMGYDNMQKKFFSTWVDNMSTGMMYETGTVDGAGKVLTMEGENWNMQANAMTKSKSICTITGEKTRKLEMWAPGPDGKMMKTMEIDYTRK